jgi:hypothetical protein
MTDAIAFIAPLSTSIGIEKKFKLSKGLHKGAPAMAFAQVGERHFRVFVELLSVKFFYLLNKFLKNTKPTF